MANVTVIGAGLAGSEAVWQLARRGINVTLYEMRPKVMTPAHHTEGFAELVCSNSLRAANVENAVGLLKEEMRRLNSLIMEAADHTRVPAGGALAVDREAFSRYVTERIVNLPNVKIIHEEVCDIKQFSASEPIVIASGPLTSAKLANSIAGCTGSESLYFYDAAAPIVVGETLNMKKIFRASRYDKGDSDYLNCPMNKEEYDAFWQELTTAETAPIKEFEKAIYFEGCMPVEEMARRGIHTLRYGPLKPVGLKSEQDDKMPYAVVQLRQDNSAATLYNIVGFQTHLKWPEQLRVFRMIPGLETAEFVRLGVMHRNTFIDSPQLLRPTLQMMNQENVFFAGQITGVEGYLESAACGLIAGINAGKVANNSEPVTFPQETAHGALCHYITHADSKHFQPMNINFGILPPLEQRIRDKKLKNAQIAERALLALQEFKEKCDNTIA